MSWAIKRQLLYLLGVVTFLALAIGIPIAYHFFSIKPTCHDGVQNQGESTPDRGGPCLLLDSSAIQPTGILWARTFRVRSGLYDAVAYINNPNTKAAAFNASYRFSIYDSRNVLVAERFGVASVMPGGPTPIFVGGISTGNRDAVHAIFEFTAPLIWKRASNAASVIVATNPVVSDTDTAPRIAVTVTNQSVSTVKSPIFIATVFDSVGNAIATGQTALSRLQPGESQSIVFTWPDPFVSLVGRVDVIPVVEPVPDKTAQQ